ncbi:hypothetical protein [Streptomyces prasinosporus]
MTPAKTVVTGRLRLAAHRDLKARLLAHRPDLYRAIGGPHDGQDLAVVGGLGGLVGP